MKRLLNRNAGERAIHAFLKKHPLLIVHAFNDAWNAIHVVPEFQLGQHLRCDFLLFGAYSNGWNIHFIELEPVGARLFNKDGTPGRSLKSAQKQISDWMEYERTDEAVLRQELARVLVAKECLDRADGSKKDKSWLQYCARQIKDIHYIVHYYHHIVIGRRHTLTEADNNRRSRGHAAFSAEIATYDRFLDIAAKFDSLEKDRASNKAVEGTGDPRAARQPPHR